MLLLFTAACSSAPSATSGNAGRVPLPLTLTSSAFVNGGAIPADFSCDGRNTSPPLSWSAPPAATQALAVLVQDEDVPGTFTDWALYDLTSGTSLPPGIPASATLASGGKQALNGTGAVGYAGPCPPRGSMHQYVFRIIALDRSTGLPPGSAAADVKNAMQGHIIAMGELAGTYTASPNAVVARPPGAGEAPAASPSAPPPPPRVTVTHHGEGTAMLIAAIAGAALVAVLGGCKAAMAPGERRRAS